MVPVTEFEPRSSGIGSDRAVIREVVVTELTDTLFLTLEFQGSKPVISYFDSTCTNC